MARLLLVSNRLPVTVKTEHGKVSVQASSGGLASGLAGPHRSSGGLWLGWPGETSKLQPAQLEELGTRLQDLHTVPLHLTAAEVSRYYEGFSNRVLWPLFHYQVDRLPLHAKDWNTYRKVNQRFAEQVAAHYKPGDHVWVQDYQLMLVPGLLREMLPEARIGFFLHIPFPAPDVFRVLPWRREVLTGLLGADVVGFHTQAYARHFESAVEEILGISGQGELPWAGRDVQVGAFPMGIDAAAFDARARSEETERILADILKDTQGHRLILGVDRLDYTKGIRRRILAVEQLLIRVPALRGKLRFIQVAVPSRTNVDAYATFRREVDEHVGRINGTYGTPTSMPIHYLYRSIPANQLSALYRAAEVMLVTPLRDGMNLVAKEFIASRVDEDGILVLSEFAGAAPELPEALQVNPYDLEGVANTLARALHLPKEERQRRMRRLRAQVREHDVHRWSSRFLKALDRGPEHGRTSTRAPSPAPRLEELRRALLDAPERYLLLDYDGTLVPIVTGPEHAAPSPELRRLLQALARQANTHVHVVSGRPRDTLEAWLGDLPLGLHAEHGLWSRVQPGGAWQRAFAADAGWMAEVRALLQGYLQRTPGAELEEKTASFAWHYRKAPLAQGEMMAQELLEQLRLKLEGRPLGVLQGKKVLEVRPEGMHKGIVVAPVVAARVRGAMVLAAGDDTTDEDLFDALPPGGVSLHVGEGASVARYRLPSPAFLLELLRGLL